MKIKLCLTLGLSLAINAIVFGQTGKMDSSRMRTLRIDPSTARGATASQLFDEVIFIPLETTKESLFGTISRIEFLGSTYVIFDQDTKAILLFDQSGKFKSKLSASTIGGESQGEAVEGFDLATDGTRKLIALYFGKSIRYYDTEGKLVANVKGMDKRFNHITTFADGTDVLDGYKFKSGENYDLALVKDEKELAGYFPYSNDRYSKDDYSTASFNFLTDSKIPDERFFTTYYDYNIYAVSPKKVSIAYRILFTGDRSLPADFKTNPVYVKKRQEFSMKDRKVITGVHNPYLVNHQLFFAISDRQGWRNTQSAFAYDLNSGNLISVKDIGPDAMTSYLPVTDAGAFSDFATHGFHFYDGKYLYTSYSSLAMFSFKDQSAEKKPQYPPVLAEYFATQTKKSNPVIIKLKVKPT